ncbi:hypothetical protein TCSYLVIO_001298 [Trypanosoma cruzi]|nr:hypothetical protein TCSYLVIO_001298 [Trypanosoma cruzi]
MHACILFMYTRNCNIVENSKKIHEEERQQQQPNKKKSSFSDQPTNQSIAHRHTNNTTGNNNNLNLIGRQRIKCVPVSPLRAVVVWRLDAFSAWWCCHPSARAKDDAAPLSQTREHTPHQSHHHRHLQVVCLPHASAPQKVLFHISPARAVVHQTLSTPQGYCSMHALPLQQMKKTLPTPPVAVGSVHVRREHQHSEPHWCHHSDSLRLLTLSHFAAAQQMTSRFASGGAVKYFPM